MDYRGVGIIGVWIGIASIIAIFNHYGYLAEASLVLVAVAFILTNVILNKSPEGESTVKLADELKKLNSRLADLEENVNKINKLLEE